MTRHNHKVSTNRQGFPRLHFKVGLAASQAKKKKIHIRCLVVLSKGSSGIVKLGNLGREGKDT